MNESFEVIPGQEDLSEPLSQLLGGGDSSTGTAT
jgi:hypothetical protein